MKIELYKWYSEETYKAVFQDDSNELETIQRTPLTNVPEKYINYIIKNVDKINHPELRYLIENKDFKRIYIKVNNKLKTNIKISRLDNKWFEKKKIEVSNKLKLMMKLNKLSNPEVEVTRSVRDLVENWGITLSLEWINLISEVIDRFTTLKIIKVQKSSFVVEQFKTHELILTHKKNEIKFHNKFEDMKPLESFNAILLKFKTKRIKGNYYSPDKITIDFSKPSLSIDRYTLQSKSLDKISLNMLIKYLETFHNKDIVENSHPYHTNYLKVIDLWNNEYIHIVYNKLVNEHTMLIKNKLSDKFNIKTNEILYSGHTLCDLMYSCTHTKLEDDKYFSMEQMENIVYAKLKLKIFSSYGLTVTFMLEDIDKLEELMYKLADLIDLAKKCNNDAENKIAKRGSK